MTASELRHMTLARLFGDQPVAGDASQLASCRIRGICLDSRLAAEGDLYLALAGGTVHGLQFIPQAIERRVAAVAAESGEIARFGALRRQLADAGVVFVEVTGLKQLAGSLAARFFGDPSVGLQVVAVTGTDGKTSVCHFVQDALQSLGTPCGYIGTLGWGLPGALQPTALTTPDAVSLQAMLADLRDAGARVVALEASSHGLAEGRLDAVAIDVAVLTNLGRDHLDYHVSLEQYRAAKMRLFRWPSLRAQVVNLADPVGRDLANASAELATYGFDSRAAAPTLATDQSARSNPLSVTDVASLKVIEAHDLAPGVPGLQFTLMADAESVPVDSALVGRFNVDNLLACAGVLCALGHAANDAGGALSQVRAVPGRMERFTAADRSAVIVDYAHTPDALQAALAAARHHCRGLLWVVFGCGGDRDPGKRAPMGLAAEAADRIIVTDDNPRTENAEAIRRQIVAGMQQPSRATVIGDRAAAIRHAIDHSGANDVVLVAGKGHEDYQVIGTERRDYSDRDTVVQLLAEAV